MKNKIPFEINCPIAIFNYTKRINYQNFEEMEEIFKRNMYFNSYEGKPNLIFKQRRKKYGILLEKTLNYLQSNYSLEDILSISIFGSSLFSNNPGDYDFLVITKGNKFKMDHAEFHFGKEIINMGLSIKGVENYTKGYSNLSNSELNEIEKEIIDRTTMSLFKGRLPLYGYDFIENENFSQEKSRFFSKKIRKSKIFFEITNLSSY